MDKGKNAVTYGSKDAVLEDFAERSGNIEATQPVKIGKLTTTPGRLALQALFGDDIVLDSDIAKPGFSMKKKLMGSYLDQAARQHPSDYPNIVGALKDIGFDFSQKSALSFSLGEFIEAGAARDKILDKYEGRVEKARGLKGDRQQKALSEIMSNADKELRAAASALAEKGNRPAQMLESGEKPSWDQFKQFMMSPVLSADSDGKLVPELIRTSYGDGMTQGAHTLAAIPARKSMVQKTVSVAGPGYLTKQIIAPMVDTRITQKDCKTKSGIDLTATSTDVMDRFLARDVKAGKHTFKAGTAVTPEVMGFIGDMSIPVRSPQTCASPNGVCQKCFGNFPDGPPALGMNIGVIAGQSIGERGTQLALRAFHTGGVGKAAVTSSLDRVEQLLRMPKSLPNKAILSEVGGRITDVRRDPSTGARYATVAGREHYVPPRKKMVVNRGMTVKPGDPLTEGPKDPREILKINGMPAVRKYLTDELHNIYSGEGIKRRMSETVVRGITDLGIVKSSGGRTDLVAGDKISLRTVEDWNKGRAKTDQVVVEPVLIGVNRLGLDYTTDWLSRLSFEHLKDTIVDAARRGWKSEIGGEKQLSRIAYGGDPNRPTL
jgi:DNA-directed RNA polymerase subunit beta'